MLELMKYCCWNLRLSEKISAEKVKVSLLCLWSAGCVLVCPCTSQPCVCESSVFSVIQPWSVRILAFKEFFSLSQHCAFQKFSSPLWLFENTTIWPQFTGSARAPVWKSTVIPLMLLPVNECIKKSSQLMCSEVEALCCRLICCAAGSPSQHWLYFGAGLWPGPTRHQKRLNPHPAGRLIWD